MDIYKQIVNKIKEFDTIIIHRHQRPDPDAFGSQGGLATIIRDNFENKTVYEVGHNTPGLSWITENVEISDDKFENALIIVTDTANRPRVDDDRYNQGKFLIKIDHHPDDDHYGDISLVDTNASSSSEIITNLVIQTGLKLSKRAAEQLYAGIVGDTGRFMYDATTANTMRCVAVLMETHIDSASINRKLDDISLPVARLSAYVYENMKVTANDAAYIVLTNEILDQFDLGDSGTAAIVPLMGKISTVLCWTVFVEQKDGSYRLRIRSKAPIINELAKKYDGGGHPLASGAKIDDSQQIPEFVAELDKIAKNYKRGN